MIPLRQPTMRRSEEPEVGTLEPMPPEIALAAEGVEVQYRARHGRGSVRAVDGVDLQVRRGETVGIVGESGSGKSTLGRALVGLERRQGGRIVVDGAEVPPDGALARAQRLDLQMIFQDPFSSLNPRRRLGDAVAQAVRARDGDVPEGRVAELLQQVGLDPHIAHRYPHEASGGQLQRVVIARVLATRPKLIVADEPVSALDVSVQAQVLNLFADLCEELSLTTVFISHDLAVVRHIADRIAVMYLGRIVETAPAEQLIAAPRHPYTEALLTAVPGAGRERILLQGDPPDPSAPPSGCRFRTRCGRATELCAEQEPLLEAAEDGHAFACHHPVEAASPAVLAAP